MAGASERITEDSLFRHTPGPWIVVQGGVTKEWYVRPQADKRSYLAAFDDTVDGEANARLIAAAPDLLEALVRLFSVVMDETVAEFLTPESPVVQAAGYAIAKAEGAA